MKQRIVFATLFFSVLFIQGCGVKGDPLPPLEEPEIGRGRPTYKKAMREAIDPTLFEEEEKKKNKRGGR